MGVKLRCGPRRVLDHACSITLVIVLCHRHFWRGDHTVLGFRNVMSEFLCACLNWAYRRRLKSAGCGDGLSGDPAGLRASQERYNVSNVFWLSHSAHGGVLGNLR